MKLMPYANLWTLVWEILFYGCILTILIEELHEVTTGLYAAAAGGRCRCIQFFRCPVEHMEDRG